MSPHLRFAGLQLCALLLACLVPAASHAESIAVHRRQEVIHHPFLLEGKNHQILASGEEVTAIQGDLVHSRLTFHFLDGSLDDEQTVFTQGPVFHLVSDHHVQKGPSFPDPLDLSIDVPSGTVTWHETSHGKDRTRSQHLDLPADLANGIMPLLVENFPSGAQEMKVSWVAVAVKPLIVNISVKPQGTGDVDPAGVSLRSNEYLLHPELHGFVGFLAPIVAKQPADLHIWVTDDNHPSFIRLTGPFYQGGPDWTVEPTGVAVPGEKR